MFHDRELPGGWRSAIHELQVAACGYTVHSCVLGWPCLVELIVIVAQVILVLVSQTYNTHS